LFSGELFIGVNFTAIALENDRSFGKDPFVSIQLGYGIINQLESAFPLFSNVQLRATLVVIRRETLTNTKLAALEFQKAGRGAQKIYQHRYIFVQFHDLNFFNIDKVFPDSNPPISGEFFSSLRIFIPADLFSVLLPGANESVRDVGQSTIIGETSILGGLWTFMTGIFSLIFGSSLLLVIFGTPSE